jgi:hypothetical protein
MVLTYIAALICSVIVFFYFKEDHILSPLKFAYFLNIAYFFLPVTLTEILRFGDGELSIVFPSLYDEETGITILVIYLYSMLCMVILRFLFRKFNFSNIDNIESNEKDDKRHAVASSLLIVAAIGFIALAILSVGLDAYRTYAIDPTIGGDAVAQSFKSQGEYMLSLFSIPVINYLYRRKKSKIFLIAFLGMISAFSALGGARKFLLLPFIFLMLLISSRQRKSSWLPVVSVLVALGFILSIVQNIRSGLGANASLGSIISSLFEQFVYAYVVPSGLIYFHGEHIANTDFSLLSFLALLIVNPILYVIPRFLLPDKDTFLLENEQNSLLDYNTVGGSSYIFYFLSSSYGCLFLAIPIILLMICGLFALNQSKNSKFFFLIYLGSLINSFGFMVNLGYVIPIKTLISQVLINVFIYWILYKVLFSRADLDTEPIELETDYRS